MTSLAWKKYESEIYKYFSETFPDTSIKYDQKLEGKYSKVRRQIDILIEGTIAGYPIMIIVDCKYFFRNVDVKEVESFSSMIEDVGAHQGILITNKGFTKAATNRAYYGPRSIELDILNFNVIKSYQGLEAIPYAENHCVFLSAPIGWVIDIKNKVNGIASIYQRGLSLTQAQKRSEWIYLTFWNQSPYDKLTIDMLIKKQNEGIIQFDPETQFEYKTGIKNKHSVDSKIRIAAVKSYKALEVTGFVDFGEFIFFAVMFTPKEYLDRNLRKLYFLLSSCVPANIKFDNSQAIERLLAEIEKINSSEEKSDKYHQVGKWYVQMNDFKNAIIYFKKSLEFFPSHFTYLKHIIDFSLRHEMISDAIHYSSELFSYRPNSPVVTRSLLEIYIENLKENILIKFINDKIANSEDLEVKGNLHFSLGHIYLTLDQNSIALENLVLAREYFQKSLPKNHHVFKVITEIIKQNGL